MAVHGNRREPTNPVDPADACPKCGMRECDELVWFDDDRVECQRCGTVYRPGSADDSSP